MTELAHQSSDVGDEHCNWKDCESTALWQVGWIVWADRARYPEAPPLRAHLGVYVCVEHGKRMTTADILTPQGIEQINDGIRRTGEALPDWETAEPRLYARNEWMTP